MGNLESSINKEIEKRLDNIIENIIFPKFKKIAYHSVKKNYYDLYVPIQYKRKYRLQKEWVLSKKNRNYEIYIREDIIGEWKGKKYYLPQLVIEGKVIRKENGIYTNTPRPFISNLKVDLNKNKVFRDLLKKYGLTMK